jgi:hypothetical protein
MSRIEAFVWKVFDEWEVGLSLGLVIAGLFLIVLGTIT